MLIFTHFKIPCVRWVVASGVNLFVCFMQLEKTLSPFLNPFNFIATDNY